MDQFPLVLMILWYEGHILVVHGANPKGNKQPLPPEAILCSKADPLFMPSTLQVSTELDLLPVHLESGFGV